MATSSFLRSVHIGNKKDACKLVKAMEQSQSNPGKEVIIPYKVQEMTKEQMQCLFRDKQP